MANRQFTGTMYIGSALRAFTDAGAVGVVQAPSNSLMLYGGIDGNNFVEIQNSNTYVSNRSMYFTAGLPERFGVGITTSDRCFQVVGYKATTQQQELVEESSWGEIRQPMMWELSSAVLG